MNASIMRRLEMYQDVQGDWRWRLRANNGKILADSGEGYVEYRDAIHGAYLVWVMLSDERTAGLLTGAA